MKQRVQVTRRTPSLYNTDSRSCYLNPTSQPSTNQQRSISIPVAAYRSNLQLHHLARNGIFEPRRKTDSTATRASLTCKQDVLLQGYSTILVLRRSCPHHPWIINPRRPSQRRDLPRLEWIAKQQRNKIRDQPSQRTRRRLPAPRLAGKQARYLFIQNFQR